MANKTGHQPDIKYSLACKGDLLNIPRNKMKSKGCVRKDGTVSKHTHTINPQGVMFSFVTRTRPPLYLESFIRVSLFAPAT